MMAALVLVVTGGGAAFLTALLVPPVTRLSTRKGWLAHPGPRHIHQSPTPTVGGLAILGGVVGALVLSLVLESLSPLLQRSPYEHLRLGLLLAGAAMVAGVSFLDDVRPLAASLRLGVHIGAALVVVGPYLWDQTLYPDANGYLTEARGIILTAFNFPFIDQVHLHALSPWLAVGATIVWVVGLQNMLNWVDGLDGLAAGVTLIAALVLTLHSLHLGQWTVALLPLALAGACAGFLPFNVHPAQTFMGDVGAMTLGYVLAASAIIGGAKLATALLVLAVPLVDMAWLILWRLRHGRSAASPGRDHLHHRLVDLGFSQRQVAGFYYVLSAASGSIALLDWITPAAKLVALAAMGMLVMTIIWSVSRRPAPVVRNQPVPEGNTDDEQRGS
ncbi:MAG: undecaprenyl/decaprenyl-phosphate alpha-N-acetylglucosaminyl 1-phosphate transferase [Chloroflexaceae bacterium]|nr:undecaprenyl/decaprenyl-phosphate alpha-N-acetylglucosaminyl 1-phosphate transferase [Chloroflexaceae bacterium]